MSEAAPHIADLIGKLEPGAFVNRFIVVAEVIGADGERGVWIDTSDDLMPWDRTGLLMYALDQSELDPDD